MKITNGISKIILAVILVGIVAISGCTGGGDVSVRGAGGDALELGIDTEGRSTFDSLEPFLITVQAENTGDFDAETVEARLQGYAGITPTEGGIYTLSDAKAFSPSTFDRPLDDVPGTSGTIDYDVKAPYVSEGAPDVEINLNAEVKYNYRSLLSRRIVAATAEEVNKRENRGEDIPVSSETKALNGPVSISMETEEPYERVTGATESVRLKIHLQNDGSGNICRNCFGVGDKEYDYITKVTLKVPAGITIGDDCDLETVTANTKHAVKTLVLEEGDTYDDKLRLTGGGAERSLYCRLVLYSDHVAGFNTYDLEATTDYAYLQSVSKKLIVQGVEEPAVRASIKYPTRVDPDSYNTSGGETHHVRFTVEYYGAPLTGTGTINVSDITSLKIGETAVDLTDNVTSVTFNSTTQEYDLTCKSEALSAGTYDVFLTVSYASESAVATASRAVVYQ